MATLSLPTVNDVNDADAKLGAFMSDLESFRLTGETIKEEARKLRAELLSIYRFRVLDGGDDA